MKKFVCFIALLFVAGPFAFAQSDAQKAAAEVANAFASAPTAKAPKVKTTNWDLSSDFTLGFNQTALSNWAAGGYNTISLAANIDAQANYAKNLTSWTNRLRLDYGFLWSADKAGILQKSSDRIYLESQLNHKIFKDSKWSYSAGFDFKTQFSEGYDKYYQDSEGKWVGNPISNFLSPAYINLALGMQWKPLNWFDLSISPLTGSIVICSDARFRKSYSMPVDAEGNYAAALFQLGLQVKANAKVIINDNITYETQVVLFTDYIKDPFGKIRVNWDNKLSFQVAKYFKVGLDTWLIYDPLVKITRDGVERQSLVQFKEALSINFIYTIHNKKKK